MRRLVFAFSALALLTACETTSAPPLGPSIQAVEAGRYHITYRGSSHMSEQEVRDRALLQAAQTTLRSGYDWFQVAGRTTGIAPPTGPQFSFGLGGASFGRRSAVGGEVGTTLGGEGTSVTTLEIVLGRGAKPAALDAYDARDVDATLGRRFS
jgi:hypothetical protein